MFAQTIVHFRKFSRFFLGILMGLMPLKGFSFVAFEGRPPTEMEGELLTPFWAQEYIGADLVKSEMRQMTDLQRVPFAVYDIGFEKSKINLTTDIQVDPEKNGRRLVKAYHGTSVANLINGPGMVSVSEVVDYVQLRSISPAMFYFSAVNEIKNLARKPWIISNSAGWASPDILDLAKEVDAQGIIWVLAVGNDYPEVVREHERIAPVISVGSYSPRGLQTLSSQETDQLDILAPADEYLSSITVTGEQSDFGETSGATPLVSGSIANVKALLPSLTRTQIETVMKRTAIRSLHSYYAKNKTQLFNAYKMFRVVKKIKDACGDDSICIQAALDNSDTYLFTAENLSENTKEICRTNQILSPEETLALRRNYLLSENPASWARLLSCAYRNEGFRVNADYYENISLIYNSPRALQFKIRKQAVTAILKDYGNSASLRDPELLDENYKQTLLQMIDKQNSDVGFTSTTAREFLERYEQTKKVLLPQ